MKLPDGPPTPRYLRILRTLQWIFHPLDVLEERAQRYGDIFALGKNTSTPLVYLSNPEAIRQILTADSEMFESGRANKPLQFLLGENSLILLDGRKHQRQRRLLMPPFHGDRMKAYGQTICQITSEVIEQWVTGESIAINQFMPDITLQIILQVVFGISPGERYEKLKTMLSSLLEDITTPWYSSLFFFPPLQQDLGAWSPWGHYIRRLQQIDNLIYAEIAQRRVENESPRTDILSMLMSARDENGQQMTDMELRDQLVSLLLLGYETTAAALAWVFYLIHSHPQVLDKLRQELDSLGENPQPDAIATLPYLSAVCQESLRIYPIALICTPRMVKDSVQVTGYNLPSGAIVVPCIYLAHRRAETYPQPEQFLPERFLQQKFSPFEYLPFGGGSRGCIGAAFSMYEMKLVLVTVLSHFELDLANQRPVYPVRRGITIVPSDNGVKMVVKAKRQMSKTPVQV
ncbi:MAG TPA: cytochrome P450 [Cyanobacteria bacterium UBA11049]|nr:cytochrome P450 [Cyanobacteria bacterium UBA11049]